MKPLIILSGPTAVGKTDLSIRLAKAVNGEIISADSMQVYRRMNIGTAKITKEEMKDIPHHLVDIIEPQDEWNVKEFARLSAEAIRDIHSRKHVPIITGGTGFYIQAVLYDIDFSEEPDNDVRKRLTEEYEKYGADYLYEKLMQADPDSCKIIHRNNVKRVIRALEYYELTGEQISVHNREEHEKQSPYDYVYFVLDDDRAKLYERIDRRVDRMLEEGLVDEVRALMKEGLDLSYVSMQGLGYKEIYRYLTGELSFSEAVYILKRDTRHFAKRQLTWFRREKDVVYVDRSKLLSEDRMLEFMLGVLKERGIV